MRCGQFHRTTRAAGIGFLLARLWSPLAVSAAPQTVPAETAPQGKAAVELQTISVGQGTPPAEAAAAPEHRAIQEIVVTATKREESVRDVPITIDAFSGEELAQRGANDLESILKYSTGVTLSRGSSSDSSNITIRGVGGTSKYFNRTFGLFYGDVSLVNPSLVGAQPDVDPFDIASVEVLKGPQGTLFGGSALAGAVRYVPAKPTFDEVYGSVGFRYGVVAHSGDANDDVMAMANLPLSDHFALRASGVLRHAAGYTDDTYAGRDDINSAGTRQGQLQVLWEPAASLALRLFALDRYSRRDDNPSVDFFGNDANRYEVSQRHNAEPSYAKTTVLGLAADLSSFDAAVITAGVNQVKKRSLLFNDVTPAYGLTDLPGASAPQQQTSSSRQRSYELRVVSAENTDSRFWLLDNWKYTAGLFYLDADQLLALNIPVPTLSTTMLLDRLGLLYPAVAALPDTGDFLLSLGGTVPATNNEKALFFDLTKYVFSDRLEINFGGRLYDQRAKGELPAVLLLRQPDPLPTLDIPLSNDSPRLHETGLNPKLAVTWHLNDDISLYGSAVKGFRFGGFNADPLRTGEPEPTYKSDTLWNYEVGLRTEWLDGRLQWDTTAFYMKWKNMQLEEFIRLGVQAYVLNVGGSENPGVETSIKAVLPFDFLLVASAGYSDAHFSESFTTPSGGHGENGTSLPNSPYVTGSLVLSYDNSWRKFDYGGTFSYSYQGASHNDLENHIPLPAFGLFDLALRAKMPGVRFAPQLQLTVTNLLNENKPVTGLYESGTGITYGAKVLTVPRTITLGLSLNF